MDVESMDNKPIPKKGKRGKKKGSKKQTMALERTEPNDDRKEGASDEKLDDEELEAFDQIEKKFVTVDVSDSADYGSAIGSDKTVILNVENADQVGSKVWATPEEYIVQARNKVRKLLSFREAWCWDECALTSSIGEGS